MRSSPLILLLFLCAFSANAQLADTAFNLLGIADPQALSKSYNRGVSLMNQGEYLEAVPVFDRVLLANPEQTDAASNKAICLFMAEDYPACIVSLNELIEKEINADLCYLRGLAYYQSGEMDKAEVDFSRCLGIDANMSEAYYARSLVRQATGDPRSAVRDLIAYTEFDSAYAPAWYDLAYLYYSSDQYELAIGPSAKARNLDPDNSPYRYLHAILQYELGSSDEAIRDLALLTRDDPSFDAAINELALLLAFKGQIKEAEAQLAPLANNPEAGALYKSNYGYILYSMERYPDAVPQFTRAIEMEPDNAVFWFNRAACKEMARDYQGACADWKEANRLGMEEAQAIIEKQCK